MCQPEKVGGGGGGGGGAWPPWFRRLCMYKVYAQYFSLASAYDEYGL